MITWPIFVAAILAFFAVRYVINMEEVMEQEIDERSEEQKNIESESKIDIINKD